ncbi:MAG: NAD-dependent epimerase/dehydratase family protein [Acidimicrobiales bacterium]
MEGEPAPSKRTIVVTGAAGSVGRRVCALLAPLDDLHVLAIDLEPPPSRGCVEGHRVDLRSSRLTEVFAGADAVVHLASSFRPVSDGVDVGHVDIDVARNVFAAAADAGVALVVVLSSAMVYGAHPTNSIPILEDAPLDPNPEFSFAVVKAEIEALAEAWQRDHSDRTVVVLRPTTAIAKGEVSWVARGLRAASLLAVGDDDPPVQYLHLDDLAAAVLLATTGSMHGAYNVAPDGSVEGATVRELSGRTPRVRMPEWLAEELGRFRWRHGLGPTPPGLTPYTVHPWVVANDRLRRVGWEPAFTNEEAYVDGVPAKPWAALNAKRRQQLALGTAGAVTAAAGIGAAVVAKRLRRR